MAEIEMFWHEIRFDFNMENKVDNFDLIHQADSPIHSMIALEIFGPLVAIYNNEMLVWRFHRAIKPKERIHYFRFKFYGNHEIPPKLNEHILSNNLYKEISDSGLLTLGNDNSICKSTGEINLKDDCDRSWSDEIKEIWPYYINGVSRAWLKMIEITASNKGTLEPSILFNEKLTFYSEVNKNIETIWQKEGCHAMLHHLNAVFGYKYIQIKLINPIGEIFPVLFKAGEKKVPGIVTSINF